MFRRAIVITINNNVGRKLGVPVAATTGRRTLVTMRGGTTTTKKPCILGCNNNTSPKTTTTTTTSHILVRTFAKKKKGGGGERNKIKVFTIWSGDAQDVPNVTEEEDYPPDLIIDNKGNNLDAFIHTYKEKMGIDDYDLLLKADDDDESLEIYNSATKEFEPLTSMDQINKEHNTKGKIFLAPREEEDYPDNDFGEDYGDYDYSGDPDEDDLLLDPNDDFDMRTAVEHLVVNLHEAGWKPHKTDNNNSSQVTTRMIKENGETIPTKQAILELAADNPQLQDLLISKIGALDHFATVVHFDFVWKNVVEGEIEQESNAQKEEFQEQQK